MEEGPMVQDISKSTLQPKKVNRKNQGTLVANPSSSTLKKKSKPHKSSKPR